MFYSFRRFSIREYREEDLRFWDWKEVEIWFCLVLGIYDFLKNLNRVFFLLIGESYIYLNL